MTENLIDLRCGVGAAPRSLDARIAALLRSWLKRIRQRRRLDSLSDHLLKDMGLVRFAEHEVHERLWRG